MIADYWIVRRGHYRINDLYTLDQEGWYWYTAGINWRAFAAYLWYVRSLETVGDHADSVVGSLSTLRVSSTPFHQLFPSTLACLACTLW